MAPTTPPVSPIAVPPGVGSGVVVATADGPTVVPVPTTPTPTGVPLDYPDPSTPDYWLRLPDLIPAPSLLPFLPFIDPERAAKPTTSGHSLADALADVETRRRALGVLGDDGLALLDRRDTAQRAAVESGAAAILNGKAKPPAPFDPDAWRLAIRRKAEEASAAVDAVRVVVARVDDLLDLHLGAPERAAILDGLRDARTRAVEAAAALESAVQTDSHLRALLDGLDRRQGLRDDYRASVLGRLVGAEVMRARRRNLGALQGLQADASAVTTAPEVLDLLAAWTPALDAQAVAQGASPEDLVAHVRKG